MPSRETCLKIFIIGIFGSLDLLFNTDIFDDKAAGLIKKQTCQETAHPFIAVNAAGAGADQGAVINYSGNILNTDAEIVGDQEWPWNNPTAEGGEVNDEAGYGANELQDKTQYVLIGWDFDNVWTFDTESGYLYPVLKSIGVVNDQISTSIQGVQSEQKAATTGIYDLQGRRMNSQKQLQKGLYIINGRKVVVK